ncbi:hypothetical protein NPIL_216181 [Nephila pilipes]|uniref:Uncharacterized protein n=1 Tax=Nephila pilipes TaxID=299642 RepID=A0A8X6NFH6_NEPPI|nr:hypothetical protein NPIL_216181 [Nephila pilipes]
MGEKKPIDRENYSFSFSPPTTESFIRGATPQILKDTLSSYREKRENVCFLFDQFGMNHRRLEQKFSTDVPWKSYMIGKAPQTTKATME